MCLATFGAGCFWGTEKFFAKNFAEKHPHSILGTSVGFMHPDGSKTETPTYDEVYKGSSGHIEVV